MPIFNLPLCHYLKRLFKEHPPKRGSVTVLSQGEIARMIFDRAGVSVIFPEPTASVEVRTPFFQKTLPEALGKVLVNGGVSAAFDALVVDEAQDHDTAKPGLPDGWWGVYRSLLTDCAAAPVAVFFDLNQRALFNSTTTFDPAEVNRVFPGCVRVRLDRALRYTGNIRRYVAKISGIPLVDTDEDSHSAAGMPVTDCEVDASGMAAAIATLIAKWRAAGIVTEPGHVLLLSPRGALARTSLAGHAEIAGVPVAEYDETAPENRDVYRHLNIHRAKGLDERAVILFDLLKPESSPNPAQTRQSHLLGASRARQALAVLWLKAPASA